MASRGKLAEKAKDPRKKCEKCDGKGYTSDDRFEKDQVFTHLCAVCCGTGFPEGSHHEAYRAAIQCWCDDRYALNIARENMKKAKERLDKAVKQFRYTEQGAKNIVRLPGNGAVRRFITHLGLVVYDKGEFNIIPTIETRQ